MGTLSFSTLASTILASISSANRNSSLSDICLRGNLDLSLWKSIGDEDDDDDDEDQEDGRPTPSPILAPLLAIKKVATPNFAGGTIQQDNDYGNVVNDTLTIKEANGGVLKDTDKKPLSSLATSCPLKIVPPPKSTLEQRKPDTHYIDKVKLSVPFKLSSSPSVLHQNVSLTKGSKSNNLGQVAPPHNRLHGESVLQQPLGPSSVEQNKTNSEKPQEVREHLVQLPPIEPKHSSQSSATLLSSFIGRFQLSRGSQFPSGDTEGEKLGKRVGFSTTLEMESQPTTSTTAPAASTAAISSSPGERLKRDGSGKDASSRRSRSGSAARRPSSRPNPQDLLQEIRKMSLASQDAQEEKRKAAQEALSAPSSGKRFGRRTRQKRRKAEEVFTDKDRAAAVTLGSKDIKQSLKAKKKRDRKMRLSISFISGEDYVIGTLLGEAAYQMRVKQKPEAALHTLNKALEIQPNHKGALVARSQCYLKLGDALSALKDAEAAWGDPSNPNETYAQGLLQYAEALYQLGEFEKALIAFHRGHRVRKDTDGFRIGIQKCQEAIRRAIGDKSATSIPNLDTVLPIIQEFEDVKKRLGPESKEDTILKNIAKYKIGDKIQLSSTADTKVKSKMITRELMGQLYLDKAYLKKFINRPEVINQQGLAKGLRDEAYDALKYLESRENFWRQQNPLYSRKNFNAMLKAHAHEAACRKQSISADRSIAKYLERRGSTLINSEPVTLPSTGKPRIVKRQTSTEFRRAASHERSLDRKSAEKLADSKNKVKG